MPRSGAGLVASCPNQRVIRREPKIECYVLTKVKSPSFFGS